MAYQETYTPHKWVILEVIPGELYKVLGGWGGGYLGSDEWQINSGIEELKEENDHYIAIGFSGSKYILYKEFEGLMMVTSEVVQRIASAGLGVKVVTVEEYKDIVN